MHWPARGHVLSFGEGVDHRSEYSQSHGRCHNARFEIDPFGHEDPQLPALRSAGLRASTISVGSAPTALSALSSDSPKGGTEVRSDLDLLFDLLIACAGRSIWPRQGT